MTTNIREFQLPQGRNKNGQNYERKVGFQPGMEALVNIVAGLQKDVNRINEAITLQGAQHYANKHRNWTAHEEDITGPDGQPDGIKEVFVCDSKGNVKVINGYGLGKSTYPQRKLYRTVAPTKEERKGHTMNELLKNVKKIKDDIRNADHYEYERPLTGFPHMTEATAQEFSGLLPVIKARDYFKQNIFTARYNEFKENGAFEGVSPMIQAQIYNKALSTAYNNLIRNIVLNTKFNCNPNTTTKSQVNKIMKNPEYQRQAFDYMKFIENDENRVADLQANIDEILGNTRASVVQE